MPVQVASSKAQRERHVKLVRRQQLPLDAKIEISSAYIRAWFDYWDGDVSVSFSGGMDSTVLLHLVRQIYPGCPAFFVDTGLEYPEIKAHVAATEEVTTVRPALSFVQVLQRHGLPVVSKEVSQKVMQARRPRDTRLRRLRRTGFAGPGEPYRPRSRIPKRWLHLLDAPFDISAQCCEVLKKRPLKHIPHPFLGNRVEESSLRRMHYFKYGINIYNAKVPKSTPLAFWMDFDVWEYVDRFQLEFASCYEGEGGVDRTGCMFCMYGAHLNQPNKFQRMAVTHPKQYDYCINRLPWAEGERGLAEVLDYLGIPYDPVDVEENPRGPMQEHNSDPLGWLP